MTTVPRFPQQASADAHDHDWRRGRYHVETDMLEYACELCGVSWAGVRVAPLGDPRRGGMIRG